MLFSRLIFPVPALILLLMAACAPVPLSPATEPPESPVPARPSPETPLVDPVETPTRRPSGITGDEDLPEAVENAIATFSQTLGSASREVTVVSYEEVTWSDSCLGLGGPDEACLQALTPGYLIQLEVDGEPVEVHTDARGVNVRVKGTKGPISIQPDANQPLPVLVALQSLSETQNITLDQIKIVSVEEAEWSDSCLGLGGPAESCAAVVTPGYLIVLEVGGTEYEFHTDTTGENLRQK